MFSRKMIHAKKMIHAFVFPCVLIKHIIKKVYGIIELLIIIIKKIACIYFFYLKI